MAAGCAAPDDDWPLVSAALAGAPQASHAQAARVAKVIGL
jgi:hypothetical protein